MIQRDRLLEFFLDLVRIDSPSGYETEVARRLIAALSDLGGEVGPDPHGNLIASFKGAGEPLLLSAHMDTVQPGEGIKPIIDGDTIRTDGTTVLGGDPKAGISAILEGLRAVKESGVEHRAVEV